MTPLSRQHTPAPTSAPPQRDGQQGGDPVTQSHALSASQFKWLPAAAKWMLGPHEPSHDLHNRLVAMIDEVVW